ncbi:MAG: RloB family protein [Erysipelotrichaceae bacterium]
MREKKSFAQRTRTRDSDEAKKKYFLVYEGDETEELYFEKVEAYRNKIGINPLIELVPIIRSYSETGWSNPKKIVDRVFLNLEESRTGKISYESLLNRILDFMREEGLLVSKAMAKNFWNTLQWICEEKLQVKLSETITDLEQTCQNVVECFAREEQIGVLINDMPRIIKNRAIVYEEGFDKICFIIDRDRDSFVSHGNNNQYSYVLEKCRDNGFGFYLTNPNFEFWLLLHFDDVEELDNNMLLENPKISSRRRYTEQELRKRMRNYTKSSYDSEWFINHIDTAINNEKKYCEDENELEYSVGSRVGVLIEEMRKP